MIFPCSTPPFVMLSWDFRRISNFQLNFFVLFSGRSLYFSADLPTEHYRPSPPQEVDRSQSVFKFVPQEKNLTNKKARQPRGRKCSKGSVVAIFFICSDHKFSKSAHYGILRKLRFLFFHCIFMRFWGRFVPISLKRWKLKKTDNNSINILNLWF